MYLVLRILLYYFSYWIVRIFYDKFINLLYLESHKLLIIKVKKEKEKKKKSKNKQEILIHFHFIYFIHFH